MWVITVRSIQHECEIFTVGAHAYLSLVSNVEIAHLSSGHLITCHVVGGSAVAMTNDIKPIRVAHKRPVQSLVHDGFGQYIVTLGIL